MRSLTETHSKPHRVGWRRNRTRDAEREDSQTRPPSGLRTVGLILGPYRNLTTLTASLLALHPHCQVLNHAGARLLTNRRNFLSKYTPERFERFCTTALSFTIDGERGDFGGSIRLSHAFDHPRLRQLYEERYGAVDMKDEIATLVWKESQLVTNHIRKSPARIDRLLQLAPQIRFIMPIRNPLDCARSNVYTGHARTIRGAVPNDVVDVLDHIIETIGWFSRLEREQPDRFFMFYQDDESGEISRGLLGALELTHDPRWCTAFDAGFDVVGEYYGHNAGLHQALAVSMGRHLSDLPVVRERVLHLVRSTDESRPLSTRTAFTEPDDGFIAGSKQP